MPALWFPAEGVWIGDGERSPSHVASSSKEPNVIQSQRGMTKSLQV
jgi:hypothetical protein